MERGPRVEGILKTKHAVGLEVGNEGEGSTTDGFAC